jgi:hypothetical protein
LASPLTASPSLTPFSKTSLLPPNASIHNSFSVYSTPRLVAFIVQSCAASPHHLSKRPQLPLFQLLENCIVDLIQRKLDLLPVCD